MLCRGRPHGAVLGLRMVVTLRVTTHQTGNFPEEDRRTRPKLGTAVSRYRADRGSHDLDLGERAMLGPSGSIDVSAWSVPVCFVWLALADPFGST